MSKHLWEVKHSYYCNEGNYYANDMHHEYKSFKEFLTEWDGMDFDMNMVFRWDWKENDPSTDENTFNGDVNYHNGRLLLFYMGQRKAKCWSVEVSVCRADEPAVIEFLKPRWDYMKNLWAPIPQAKEQS